MCVCVRACVCACVRACVCVCVCVSGGRKREIEGGRDGKYKLCTNCSTYMGELSKCTCTHVHVHKAVADYASIILSIIRTSPKNRALIMLV